jgi:hypothetical protein
MWCRCEVAQLPARRQEAVLMRSGAVTSKEARCGVDARWYSYQLGGKKRC